MLKLEPLHRLNILFLLYTSKFYVSVVKLNAVEQYVTISTWIKHKTALLNVTCRSRPSCFKTCTTEALHKCIKVCQQRHVELALGIKTSQTMTSDAQLLGVKQWLHLRYTYSTLKSVLARVWIITVHDDRIADVGNSPFWAGTVRVPLSSSNVFTVVQNTPSALHSSRHVFMSCIGAKYTLT